MNAWRSGFLRQRPIQTAAGVLLAIVTATLGFRWARSTNPSLVSSPTPLICVNPNCGMVFSARLRPGDRPVCSACGSLMAPAFPCPHCGRPIVLNRYVGRREPTVCRHCGREYSNETE